jgi:serine/threonine protein kinase
MESKGSDFLEAFRQELRNSGVNIIEANEIKKTDIIGKGGYGKVWKGIYKGNEVAIKELLSDMKLKEAYTEISKEIKFIQAALNDKLPALYGVIVCEEESVGLVFEYIKGHPLNSVYHEMSNKTKLDVVAQLCEILVFLHGKKLIHRDIKPQNIMIEPEDKVRLIDFGVSKIAEKTNTFTANSLGTTAYMAPENFDIDLETEDVRPISISPKADVWSVGCLISELFSGNCPWGLKNSIAIENKLSLKVPYPIPKDITLEPIKKLIAACTVIEPSERPSSSDILVMIKDSIKEV